MLSALALTLSAATTTDGPDGLAIAAFVIAVVSLAWNIGNTIVRWPRIVADIRQGVTVSDTIKVSYLVSATNLGAEDTTVWNVGLAIKGSRRGHMFASAEQERLNGRPLDGPELPATLPARSTLSWTFGDEVTRGIEVGTETVAVVQRFRPNRWWHRKDYFAWAEYRSARSRTRA